MFCKRSGESKVPEMKQPCKLQRWEAVWQNAPCSSWGVESSWPPPPVSWAMSGGKRGSKVVFLFLSSQEGQRLLRLHVRSLKHICRSGCQRLKLCDSTENLSFYPPSLSPLFPLFGPLSPKPFTVIQFPLRPLIHGFLGMRRSCAMDCQRHRDISHVAGQPR